MRDLAAALRGLLGFVVALVVVPLVNLAGGLLSDLLRIPQGPAHLAADLFWVFVAGVAGSWCALRIASKWFLALALAFFAVAAAFGLAAVVKFWDDWPRWFSLGAVLSLPLQVWLGWRLSAGYRRRMGGAKD